MITRSSVLRSLFLVGALAVAAAAQSQNLYINSANASNDGVGPVDFVAHTFTVENTDASSLKSVRSLVFAPNPVSLQVDLLAADTLGGEILRYCADFNLAASPPGNTAGAVVWSATETPGGPTNPDGISMDSAGNLFLINQGSGTSTTPQLFVLQQLSTSCVGTPPAPTFVLIDSSYGKKETLEETLVATTTIPLPNGAPVAQINPGDLLVLTANPASVLIYPGSSGNGPTSPESGKTLINLPAGATPGGMAFWPVDNSLLITINTGTILQYTPANIFPSGTPVTFVSGLGNGEFKVKTGQGSNVCPPSQPCSTTLAYAFVADNNGGRLLEFNDQGVLISTVTTAVQHPQGLAVTNTAYQQFGSCFPNCNLLGTNSAGEYLLAQQTTAQVPGNVLASMCVVRKDPRVAKFGSCTAAANAPQSPYANGLPVKEVCGPGFDNPLTPIVIPNTMCGASNGSGFTVIRIQTGADSPGAGFYYNGKFIESDSQFTGLPLGANDPSCALPPFQVAGWAPVGAGDGQNPVGNKVLDAVNGCATPHSSGGTNSDWFFGMDLDTDNVPGGLVGYVDADYTTLLNNVAAEYNDGALTPPSPPAVTPPFGNFTFELQQCFQSSHNAFLSGPANYSGAGQMLLVADYNTFINATSAATAFAPDINFPNPSGLVRQLDEATRFSEAVRLDGELETRPPTFPTTASTFPPTTPTSPPPTVMGSPSPSATVGHKYSYAPATADFAGNTSTLTYYLKVTGPSQWLTLSIIKKNNQVQVTGTPTVPGNYNVTLTANDGCETNMPTAASNFTITVTN